MDSRTERTDLAVPSARFGPPRGRSSARVRRRAFDTPCAGSYTEIRHASQVDAHPGGGNAGCRNSRARRDVDRRPREPVRVPTAPPTLSVRDVRARVDGCTLAGPRARLRGRLPEGNRASRRVRAPVHLVGRTRHGDLHLHDAARAVRVRRVRTRPRTVCAPVLIGAAATGGPAPSFRLGDIRYPPPDCGVANRWIASGSTSSPSPGPSGSAIWPSTGTGNGVVKISRSGLSMYRVPMYS